MNQFSAKTRIVVWSLCVLLASSATALLTLQSTRLLNPRIPSGKFAVGGDEDPLARVRFEWMRLHDPATGEIPANIREKELAFAASVRTANELASRLSKNGSPMKTQLASWSARGPFNVGGRTRALGIDKRNANIILAGGVSGGMWRTTNGGTSWVRVNALNDIQSASAIAQDTRSGKEDTWYYGTGELIGNSTARFQIYRGDGIYKSTNNGVSWTKLASTATNLPQSFDQNFDYVWNVAIDPSNGSQDEVYAATLGAIKRSTDGGNTWTTTLGSFGNSSSRNTDVVVTSTGVVYATLGTNTSTQGVTSVEAGIWRSTDGVSWTNIKPASYPTTFTRVVIGVAPSNENVVYFLAETDGFGFAVSYAGDTNYTSFWKYTYTPAGNGNGTEGNGGTWENRTNNLPNFGGSVGSFANQGGYDLVAKVKPDTESTVFIGGTNLYRSTDGFASTTNTTWIGGYSVANNVSIYTNHHPDLHAITFSPSNTSVLFSGDDGGIHRTDNNLAGSGTNGGLSWTSLNNGYQTTQFYSLAIDYARSGNAIIIGGMQDNGTWFTGSTSATAVWTDLLGGDGAHSAIAASGSNYYVSSQNASIYRLIVNELVGDYTDFAKVTPVGFATPQFINPFVLDPNNTDIMYLIDGNVLWRNNNLSQIQLASQVGSAANNNTSVNWDKLTSTQVTGITYTAVSVSKSTPSNRVYLGTANGQVYRIDNANSGMPALTDVFTSKGLPTGFVSCIAVDPSNGDKAMAVFSNYNIKSLFYTTDAGGSWTNIGGAPIEQNVDGSGNGPSCRWVVILSGYVTTYVVGTSTGVYTTVSLNGTSTVWTQEGASVIGNAVVDMIVARESDGLIAVATHGNGIYTANIVTSVREIDDAVPTQFSLQPNYPNPFNPSTKLRYSIREQGRVRLNVYDASGKQVASLVDREQTPGAYEATWNARSTEASGVYFARLEAGNRVQTQKMVLLK